MEKARLKHASLVISTIPDVNDNLFLLERLKNKDGMVKTVVMAFDSSDEKILYRAGAYRVILPYAASVSEIAKMLRDGSLNEVYL